MQSTVYDLERFEPRKKPELKKVETKKQNIAVPKSKTFAIIRTVALALVICTVLGMMMYNRVIQTELTADINSVKKEITALQTENTRLSVELGSLMSIKNIDSKATELGLCKMTERQVSYVAVNDCDKVEIESKEESFIERIFMQLSELFS